MFTSLKLSCRNNSTCYMATNHSSPMGNLCCKYSAVQGSKFFLMLWQPIWWHCNSINNLILMVIIKSFDSSSLIQKPCKLSSSSNSSWTTNSLDSMVFTDWGALQESPCCHSWGSCGQAFTEEGSHTQEVSSIKLILFMDWLVSHHGGIKIWSCFEPIWFCDCGHGLWLLQCQAIFEHTFFFPGITARRCPSNSARLVLHRRKLTSWSSRVTVKMRKRMMSELVSWNKFPLKSRIFFVVVTVLCVYF